jgi:hypothetical protein
MTKHTYYQQLDIPTEWGYRAVIYTRDCYWNVQAAPYRAPLAYQLDIAEVIKDTEFPKNGVSIVPGYEFAYTQGPYNKAYEKLKSRIGDDAQWAVNLAEWKRSVGSVEKRGLQLLRFVKKLKRFDFLGAAHELGLGRPPRGVSRKKQFSNNFLEFHFGWEPAIKDIGNSIDILNSDFGSKAVKGRGSNRDVLTFQSGSGSSFFRQVIIFDSHVTIGARVRISNPNLALASQMGFINPLSVAWELVPFSFVVDWFVNVGNVLASCTDFAGMSLEDTYVTRFQTTTKSQVWGYGRSDFSRGAYVRRTIGSIPGPTLAVKPFKGFSPVRGATAIALLIQQLKH